MPSILSHGTMAAAAPAAMLLNERASLSAARREASRREGLPRSRRARRSRRLALAGDVSEVGGTERPTGLGTWKTRGKRAGPTATTKAAFGRAGEKRNARSQTPDAECEQWALHTVRTTYTPYRPSSVGKSFRSFGWGQQRIVEGSPPIAEGGESQGSLRLGLVVWRRRRRRDERQ